MTDSPPGRAATRNDTQPDSPMGMVAKTLAMQYAVDQACLAPSVHNTQPWKFVVHADRVEIRADWSRQLSAVDPYGRELVQSVGAALLNARVALAARGYAVTVERLPDPADRDLLAIVSPKTGPPDSELANLDNSIRLRHTNRRRFNPAPMFASQLDDLRDIAIFEGAAVVPLAWTYRRLVAALTRRADRVQHASPAYRAELRAWTTRPITAGDGIVPASIPHSEGGPVSEFPLRDFDTQGAGELPPDPESGVDQTMVLLATTGDGPRDWLRSGEALERLLLELTRRGCVASPITQALEVPYTRAILRVALRMTAHPQMLLRVGRAPTTPDTPRRPRSEVVRESIRPPKRASKGLPLISQVRASPDHPGAATHPVSDGRGGTTWL